MPPKLHTKHVGVKRSPYKANDKSQRSRVFNNSTNQSPVMSAIICLLSTLFCLSLLTMILFYSQLQAAEQEFGLAMTPYVDKVENTLVESIHKGFAVLKHEPLKEKDSHIETKPETGSDSKELLMEKPKLMLRSNPPPLSASGFPVTHEPKEILDDDELYQQHALDAAMADTSVIYPENPITCPHIDNLKYWKTPTKRDWSMSNEFMRLNAHRRVANGHQFPTLAVKNYPKPKGFKDKPLKTAAELNLDPLLYRYQYLDEKYVTFEPDVGGWNNIRMQFELVLVYALATGRTLVLPNDQPMYLLMEGKAKQNQHGFDDYFPFDWIATRMPVITMKEFLEREGITGRLLMHNTTSSILTKARPGNFTSNRNGAQIHGNQPRPKYKPVVLYPPGNRTEFNCGHRETRWALFAYLRGVGAAPKFQAYHNYIAIPRTSEYNFQEELKRHPRHSKEYARALEIQNRQKVYAGDRKAHYYSAYWQKQKVIHFISRPELGYRLMDHFYTFIFMEDPRMDLFVKRFVRDYVHYVNQLFCKAAVIVNDLLGEAKGGGFSTFHVRRGDLQYKEVKITAEKLLENVGSKLKKGQLLYIATDVRDKTYFDAMLTDFPNIRYLDNYTEMAGLQDINPNFLGMIDAIVCTRGDQFVGTWFSTFSAYIVRMRGYLGYMDHSNWYGDMKHRDRMQQPEQMKFPYYMREWNESWWRIDDESYLPQFVV